MPLGLAPVMLGWSKLSDAWSWLRPRPQVLGVIVFLALVLPWIFLEWRAHGTNFIFTFFFSQSVGRLSENIIGGADKGPLFYGRYFWTHLRYWSGLIAVILMGAAGAIFLIQGARAVRLWRHAVVGWFFVPVILIFCVFSMAQTKLFPYVMPLFPFAALAASAGLVAVFRMLQASPVKMKTAVMAAVGLLCLSGFGVAGSDAVRYGWKWSRHDGNLFDLSADVIYADERAVGKLIGSQNLPGYMYLWSQVESIVFYAQRPVHFLPNESEIQLPPPALLVLPSMLSSSKNFPPEDTLYRGPLLTVVKIPE